MKRVSVALATLDGERFLGEQLESLARQTVAPLELVVCDDGSDDSTVQIVQEFAQRSPFPVRVEVNDARLGAADNFLKAASLCRGELIAFCDQDDVWFERKLARATRPFDDPEVKLAIHTNAVVDAELRPTGQVFPRIDATRAATLRSSHPWFLAPGMAMVFRSELVSAADWSARPASHWNERQMIFHDEWIYLLARATGTIVFLADRLALYRQHTANVTGAPAASRAPWRGSRATGWTYYAQRARQTAEAAALLRGLADRAGSERVRARLAAAADWYRTFADALEARLPLYDDAAGLRARTATFARLVAGGVYRSRARAGVGPKALLKDAAVAVLGPRS